jgi:3',5'-cyclic AMP phosphodiesterase CpdA
MRVFALSDLHADFDENLGWLMQLSQQDYKQDALIVAGDICDKTDRFKEVLTVLKQRFKMVFFVPGNHDLWLRENGYHDSLEKFWSLIELCKAYDVRTNPVKINPDSAKAGTWIMPLFSWYVKPEEGEDSLYLEKPGEDPSLRMWSDNYLVRWPDKQHNGEANRLFLELNKKHFKTAFTASVISFSHFLPRRELMFSLNWERDKARLIKMDRNPAFNFSRVAGTSWLDKQIRSLNSIIHISGHQHRNRNRNIDGVHYISHCLGYPRERQRHSLRGIETGPLLIWDDDGAVVHSESY